MDDFGCSVPDAVRYRCGVMDLCYRATVRIDCKVMSGFWKGKESKKNLDSRISCQAQDVIGYRQPRSHTAKKDTPRQDVYHYDN